MIKKLQYKNSYSFFSQILFVLGFFTLFFNLAWLSPYTDKQSVHWVNRNIILICLNLTFFAVLFLCVYFRLQRNKNNQIQSKGLKSFLLKNYLIIIIALIFICLQLPDIDLIPAWDVGLYSNALTNSVKNFDFSLISFIKGFEAFDHSTNIYFMFMAIPQFIFYGNHRIINLQSIILGTVTLIYIYKIYLIILPPKIKHLELDAALLTAISTFAPIFTVNALGVNPDFANCAFMIIMLYYFLKDKKILTIFFAVASIFSKEIGLVLYGFFGLGLLFVYYVYKSEICKKGFLKRYFSNLIRNIYLVVPLLIFGMYSFLSKALVRVKTNSQFAIKWDNNGFHCFGYNLRYVENKLFQMFVSNFMWIISALIVIFILIIIIKRVFGFSNCLKNTENKESLINLITLIFPFIGLVAFNLFFMTYLIPRYFCGIYFYTTIIFGYLAVRIFSNKFSVRAITYFSIIVLMIAANYKTLDYFTLRQYNSITLGENNLSVYTYEFNYICETSKYNKQLNMLQKLYDKLLLSGNVKADDHFVFVDVERWEHDFAGSSGTCYYNKYLDKNTMKRKIYGSNDEVINVSEITSSQLKVLPSNTLAKKIIYIEHPRNKTQALEAVKSRYKIISSYKASIGSYYLNYYECELKQENK